MLKADEELINWLLFESKISTNQIHRDSGVALMTISDLRNKKSVVSGMRFYNASDLTDYALKKKSENS